MARLNLPHFPFYPGDWLRDGVAGCSLAAQGLWLRMMILAHDSDRYGYLTENGSPMQPLTIARRCGCDLAQYETLFSELTHTGVPSRTPEGIIYSRRMVRDARDRQKAAERQKRKRERRKMRKLMSGKRHGDVTPCDPLHDDNDRENVIQTPIDPKGQAQRLYALYPKKVGRKAALKAIEGALSREKFEVLEEAVEAYAKARACEDAQFTPNPSTWFNQERWNDDRSTWRKTHGRNGPGQRHDPEAGKDDPGYGKF